MPPLFSAAGNRRHALRKAAGVQYWPNNVTWSEFNREQHYHPTLWTATRNVKLNPGQSLYATTLSNAYDLPNGASLQAYINPNDPRHLSSIPQKIHYIAYDPNRENTDGSHYFEYTDVSQIPYKLRSAINQGNPAKFNRFDWQKVSNDLKVARYGELIDQNDKINYGIYRGDDGAIYIQVGNDYKQVKSITHEYNVRNSPKLQTKIGLNKPEPVIELREEYEKQRVITQSKQAVFGKTAVYDKKETYKWED